MATTRRTGATWTMSALIAAACVPDYTLGDGQDASAGRGGSDSGPLDSSDRSATSGSGATTGTGGQGGFGASSGSGGSGTSGSSGGKGASGGSGGRDAGPLDARGDAGVGCCFGSATCPSPGREAGDAPVGTGDQDAGPADSSRPDACGGGGTCRIGLVPVPDRLDVVHDAKRGLLYITTGSSSGQTPGAVLRWDVAASKFLEPLLTGGNFFGIDLSPSDDLLVVADAQHTGTNNWVWLVDLVALTARKLEFPLAFGEGGTFMPIFLDETTFMVSSLFEGSGSVPLRKVTTGGVVTAVATIGEGAMLARSADGRILAIAEANSSAGPVSRYDLACNQFVSKASTNWFGYEICVSRNGAQMAVPTYGGLFVYGQTLERTLGSSTEEVPLGCVYSPIGDTLYLSWMDRQAKHPSVEAYRTDTFERTMVIDPLPGSSQSNGNGTFVSGRMRISRDGTLLFSTTGNSIYSTIGNGIAIYSIAAAPRFSSTPAEEGRRHSDGRAEP